LVWLTVRALVLTGLYLAPQGGATAWNAHGHMLSAAIAYQELPSTSRAEVAVHVRGALGQ
jgi:hypothetical protein